MTCDERIEKTLNRAGQTISDLPSPIDYNIEQEEKAMEAAAQFGGGMEAYVMHLTDIIDRMEAALENVCGEMDYIRTVVCGLCTIFRKDGADTCETCMIGEGVPEDWSVDDE